MGKVVVGDAWTGNLSWAAGEGGTPGTGKMVTILSASARTLTANPVFPSTPLSGQVPTEDLDEWDRLGFWLKITKTVHTVAIPWVAVPTVYFYPHLDDATSFPPSGATGGLYPGVGHWPVYIDTGGGTILTIRGGVRYPTDVPGGQNAFPDNAALNSVYGSFFTLQANPYSGKIRPYRKVSALIQLQPNVAIAGTNTFAIELRWIYGRD